jgi:hypothetical protein
MIGRFLSLAYRLVLGIYSFGFALIIKAAPHPDSLLPFEVGFFLIGAIALFVSVTNDLDRLLNQSSPKTSEQYSPTGQGN